MEIIPHITRSLITPGARQSFWSKHPTFFRQVGRFRLYKASEDTLWAVRADGAIFHTDIQVFSVDTVGRKR